ncbi:hypothetical protein MMVgp2 [Minute virus of mice]|uniref:Uncharacterized protein n=3 Tax=Murine minute virus TaxID=10794 RepID=Q76W04_MUMIP|nr:hypothetical protein MMVgp2 [Minute virus of mice]AAA67112.1 unknown protein [Minute virus of mice]AAA69570.1 unknown protein [Minute virus of mice]CAA24311.1 unnamed protein product [Minute virus of mice]
MVGWWGINV